MLIWGDVVKSRLTQFMSLSVISSSKIMEKLLVSVAAGYLIISGGKERLEG